MAIGRVLLLLLFGIFPISESVAEAVEVEGGTYVPVYGARDGSGVEVSPFLIDVAPVTTGDYLAFVQDHPGWRRSQVKRIFAEKSYLQDWESDLEIPPGRGDSPVTHVSWFAAKAYCKAQGMRLPLLHEWEMVAMADPVKHDAREDPAFRRSILEGYESPNSYQKKVKQSSPNVYGVYDLHGLVWEWVSDFNSVILSGESRTDGDKGMFCAAGALGASDLEDYAAFMRYAFRSSLKADYAIKNLGFRCAKEKKE